MAGIGLLSVILLSLGLRVSGLERESAWYDELLSIEHLEAPNLASFVRGMRPDDPPMVPLYFALEYVWAHHVSSSIPSLRIMSIAFSMVTLIFIYVIARDMYGAAAALIACLCYSLVLTHIYYDQSIRMYALRNALALGSIYTLLRLLRDAHPRWWVAHAIANGLLIWTHLFAVVLFFTEGVFLLLSRRRNVRLLLAWGGIQVALLIPPAIWVSTIDFRSLDTAAEWMSKPTVFAKPAVHTGKMPFSLEDYYMLSVSRSRYVPSEKFGGYTELMQASADAALMAAFAFFLVLLAWKTRQAKVFPHDANSGNQPSNTHRDNFVFLLVWIIVPPATLFIASHLWRPCFIMRYISYASVPIFIVAGGAASTLNRRSAKVAVALALSFLYCLHFAASPPRPVRSDWRSAATFIESSQAGIGEEIFVTEGISSRGIKFYLTNQRRGTVSATSMEDMRPRIRLALEKRPAAWALFMLAELKTRLGGAAAFEQALFESGIQFEKTATRGGAPLVIYRLSTQPAPHS